MKLEHGDPVRIFLPGSPLCDRVGKIISFTTVTEWNRQAFSALTPGDELCTVKLEDGTETTVLSHFVRKI